MTYQINAWSYWPQDFFSNEKNQHLFVYVTTVIFFLLLEANWSIVQYVTKSIHIKFTLILAATFQDFFSENKTTPMFLIISDYSYYLQVNQFFDQVLVSVEYHECKQRKNNGRR